MRPLVHLGCRPSWDYSRRAVHARSPHKRESVSRSPRRGRSRNHRSAQWSSCAAGKPPGCRTRCLARADRPYAGSDQAVRIPHHLGCGTPRSRFHRRAARGARLRGEYLPMRKHLLTLSCEVLFAPTRTLRRAQRRERKKAMLSQCIWWSKKASLCASVSLWRRLWGHIVTASNCRASTLAFAGSCHGSGSSLSANCSRSHSARRPCASSRMRFLT